MIFIAEAKNKSPFGFYSDLCIYELFEIASQHGDWVAAHTDYRWGGSFKWLRWCANHTNKTLVAKGIHSTDDHLKQAFDCGATYALVVDRVPDEEYVGRCLIECSTLQKYLDLVEQAPLHTKFVYNNRDLVTGLMKQYDDFDNWKNYAASWLCQASGIKRVSDINSYADAFIVGEHLPTFVYEYEHYKRTTPRTNKETGGEAWPI